jgi:hypothetical protein
MKTTQSSAVTEGATWIVFGDGVHHRGVTIASDTGLPGKALGSGNPNRSTNSQAANDRSSST